MTVSNTINNINGSNYFRSLKYTPKMCYNTKLMYNAFWTIYSMYRYIIFNFLYLFLINKNGSLSKSQYINNNSDKITYSL